MLQNATILRKSPPRSPNTSSLCVSCTAPATRKTSCQILCICPTPAIVLGNATKTLTFCSLLTRCKIPCAWHAKRHPNVQKCSEPVSFLHFWLRNVLGSTTVCTFSTCQLPRVLRDRQCSMLLTFKCASRHNGMHFFDMSTSKSGPNIVCFSYFDLEMCFVPQRRALFRHVNFQTWSDNGVLCTFWLRNVSHTTMACNLSSLIWPVAPHPPL